ncbi:MAG TPA: NlpC/P60 family protein [Bacteroidota bacterium]|nr:NlpC/P60 family protein [Bacteroidota bacterium]
MRAGAGMLGLLILFASSVLFDGCGGTAPRFRSGSAASSATREPSRGARDSSRTKEADVETSSDAAASVAAGTRNFRTEKNGAISNLNQAKMMREISKMMGVSYKLGGTDENGIDCSAYTMTVYKNALGKLIPRSSAEQYKLGIPVANDDLKFGDLVFFNTTGETASHVGIYLGDDLFAHASVSLGVTISSLESYYFKQRYNGARRIIE